jgi:hypothetical protein
MPKTYIFEGSDVGAHDECPAWAVPASKTGQTITMTMTFNGVTYNEAVLHRETGGVVGVAVKDTDG